MDTNVIGRRIGAFVVDVVLAWIIVLVVAFFLVEEVDIPGGLGSDTCDVIEDEYPLCLYVNDTYWLGDSTDVFILVLVALGAWVALRVVPQGIAGTTPGKQLSGIRVVNEQGAAPGFGRSLVRELFWIVDSLPFLYLVGLITAASTKSNRRVGDMVASTYVVRAGSQSGSPPPDATTAPAPGAPAPPQNAPVWDPARNAYVHRDAYGREQIYDQATGQWRDA